MAGMAIRYTIKDLLFAMALIAVGVRGYIFFFHADFSLYQFLAWFVSPIAIGTGLGAIFGSKFGGGRVRTRFRHANDPFIITFIV